MIDPSLAPHTFGRLGHVRYHQLYQEINERLTACPKVKSVAAGFRNYVFLPNRLTKLHFNKADEADIIIYEPGEDQFPTMISHDLEGYFDRTFVRQKSPVGNPICFVFSSKV